MSSAQLVHNSGREMGPSLTWCICSIVEKHFTKAVTTDQFGTTFVAVNLAVLALNSLSEESPHLEVGGAGRRGR